MAAPTIPTDPGDYLRQLRNEHQLTQEQMAALLGVRQPTLSRVERGERGLTPGLAWRIVYRLGVGADELAPYVDSDNPGYVSRWHNIQSIRARTVRTLHTFPAYDGIPLPASPAYT